jgi:hypothetical protein
MEKIEGKLGIDYKGNLTVTKRDGTTAPLFEGIGTPFLGKSVTVEKEESKVTITIQK